MTESTFHWLDYIVVTAYLMISLSLGFFMRKQKGRDEFLTASRSMGRITVGLSVMATLFSANSFVMYPSTAYGNSVRILMALVAFWTMGPVVTWIFIPVYARLNCGTAYEYLEKRFHVSVRCLASALFIVLRVAWMAAATFAASLAISGISGIPQTAITVGLGVVAIGYTMLGGLRAVMWTDVLQFFVFFGTIVFATGLLISQFDGGASEIAQRYFSDRSNLVFDFDLDPTLRFGTIAILIGSFLEGLSAFGADQVAVQRYIAAKNTRTSQSGFLINLLGMTIVIPGLLAIGMGLFSYYDQYPAELVPVLEAELEESTKKEATEIRERRELGGSEEDADQLHSDIVGLGLNDQVFPQFIKTKFPPGVVGLLVAALMAATMSSIDSGIHSITTAVVVDFRDRLLPQLRPPTEQGEMFAARAMVVVIGILAIVLACFVGQLGDVFAVAKKTVGAFAAPLLAVFVLGLFFKQAHSKAVFIGTWLGAALTLLFSYLLSHWFAMWIFPIGFFSSLIISLLLSYLIPNNNKDDADRFTFWGVMSSSEKT